MGLQYFEALSPATIASIVAVLTNRLVTNNDVTGYYKYPFLTATLPSEIFTSAIAYGFFGAFVGVCYAQGCKKLKGLVHDWFHAPHDHDGPEPSPGDKQSQFESNEDGGMGEKKPLLGHKLLEIEKSSVSDQAVGPAHRLKGCFCLVIAHEPYRAAAAGALAGALVGVIGIFVPHVMFWGEAQLQTLIDRGRTPLPVFGTGDEPTAGLTALGYCIIDHTDPHGYQNFGVMCSFLIGAAKVVVTGLSLGTGIIGGHFWGPLFTGCAASHFLVEGVKEMSTRFGMGGALAAYPCVAILCTMGSTHVVTFRAHMAIMLILTLTISAFDPENGDTSLAVAGDYSAVFPLLVVSVFAALMLTRQTVFYPTQRSRGDIIAVPEVLCEPGMAGRPMVIQHEEESDEFSLSDEADSEYIASSVDENAGTAPVSTQLTQGDIEKEFQQRAVQQTHQRGGPPTIPTLSSQKPVVPLPQTPPGATMFPPRHTRSSTLSSMPFDTSASSFANRGQGVPELSSSRLDELLSRPLDDDLNAKKPPPSPSALSSSNPPLPKRRGHRRIASCPVGGPGDNDAERASPRMHEMDRRFGGSIRTSGADGGGLGAGSGSNVNGSAPGSSQHVRTNSGSLVRIVSYGQITNHQPSLLDQARARGASGAEDSRHRKRIHSFHSDGRPGGHSRTNSGSSIHSLMGAPAPSSSAAAHSAASHRRKMSDPLAFASVSSSNDSTGRHMRKTSAGALMSASIPPTTTKRSGSRTPPRIPRGGGGGALTLDDIELAFDSIQGSAGSGF